MIILLPFLCPNVYKHTRYLQSSSCFIRDRLLQQVLHPVHRQLTARRSHYRAGPQSEGFITNIARRIEVAIDLGVTRRTDPHTISQIQIILVAATAVVELAGWIEATNCLYRTPMPFGFVVQLSVAFVWACVTQRLRPFAVFR